MVDSAVGVPSAPTNQMQAPQVQVWSVDENCTDDSVAYWREAIRAATAGLFDISAQVELDPFSARATLRRSGPFSFVAAESTAPLPVVRRRRDFDNSPLDHFSLYLQIAGRTVSFR